MEFRKRLTAEVLEEINEMIIAYNAPEDPPPTIEGLTEQHPKGDIKAMQGFTDERKRLRVGKYRIIYKYLSNGEILVLYIMNVDSRGALRKHLQTPKQFRMMRLTGIKILSCHYRNVVATLFLF